MSTDTRPIPEHASLLSTRFGLALLVVSTAEPADRAGLVLHDMFGVPYERSARSWTGRPVAAKQLAVGARRRLQGPRRSRCRLADATPGGGCFLAASRARLRATLQVLDRRGLPCGKAGARAGWCRRGTGCPRLSRSKRGGRGRVRRHCASPTVKRASGSSRRHGGRLLARRRITVVNEGARA